MSDAAGRAALVRAIREAPEGEPTPRLVFADWLDDHGEPTRAALIRFCHASGLPLESPVADPARAWSREAIDGGAVPSPRPARLFRGNSFVGGLVERAEVSNGVGTTSLSQVRREEPISELAIPASTRADRLEEFAATLGGEPFAKLTLMGGRGGAARVPDGLACRRLRLGRAEAPPEPPRLPLAEHLELAAVMSDEQLGRWLEGFGRALRSLELRIVTSSPLGPPWLERVAAGLDALKLHESTTTTPGRLFAAGLDRLKSLDCVRSFGGGLPWDIYSPWPRALERFTFHAGEVPLSRDDLARLAAVSPRLKSLALPHTPLESEARDLFRDRTHFPELGELLFAADDARNLSSVASVLASGGVLPRLEGVAVRFAHAGQAEKFVAALRPGSRLRRLSLTGSLWPHHLLPKLAASPGLAGLERLTVSDGPRRDEVPASALEAMARAPHLANLPAFVLRARMGPAALRACREIWGPRCNVYWQADAAFGR